MRRADIQVNYKLKKKIEFSLSKLIQSINAFMMIAF